MKLLTTLTAAAALLAGSALAQNPWIAQNGLVVIEAENVDPGASNWPARNSIAGFTGTGYLHYIGPNDFNLPVNTQIITYTFEVQEAGRYQVRLRSRKDNPTSDLDNDSWVRINNDNFGKHFTTNSPGSWTFQTIWEPNHGTFGNYEVDLQPGVHTLQIGGRSQNHKIDRIHIFNKARWNETTALTTAHPESPRVPPVPTEVKYTFNNDSAGFGIQGTNGVFPEPNFSVNDRGLRMSGFEATTVFGSWWRNEFTWVLEEGETYAVTFTLESDAPAGEEFKLPTVRLRVSDGKFVTTSLMNIESIDEAFHMPSNANTKDYTVFYTVPAQAAGGNLYVAVDYLYNAGLGNDPSLGVTVREVTINRIP